MITRRSWILTLAAVTLACAHPAALAAPPTSRPVLASPAAPEVAVAAPDASALVSKVTRVTVYSDRARITREASAKVAAEPTVLAFRGLPGWVDDGSVQVAAPGARIIDVRVDRGFLAAPSDESWKKLEAEHKALLARQAAITDELAILEAQKTQIEAIKAFSIAKISQDTTIGNVSVQTYSDVLRFISDSLRTTAEARRAAQQRLDELTPEIQASQRRLADAQALMRLEETNVVVALQAPAPATVTIELTYMLPGVAWEPMHELRATTGDDKSVEVVSYAAVTQTSGEDWGGAEISFSTQSTTQSVRIPELEELTLGDTVTATRILTSQVTSFTRAQTAFQEQNVLWNRVHEGSSQANFEQVYQANMEYLQVVQGRTVKIFESLERRGTTVHFKAETAASVRGDGHPVRLRIGHSTFESTQRIVAAPEQSLNAARTLAMVNSGDQPLLPGRVALYQDGAFVGMTDIDFVAKGEQFALFLNVADHIKLTRVLDRKQSTLVRKTRNQMQVSFIVTAENLGAKETTLTLADRVPVSENRDIRVSMVTIAPAVKPDSQGLLHWDLTLKPGEKREFRIGYQIDYPAELYIETDRRRALEKNAAPEPDAPAAAPAKSRVEDEIYDLEQQF